MVQGRKPEPTALKMLKGERKDRINTHEPPVPVPDRVPEPPEWIAPQAAAVWTDLAPALHAARVFSAVDVQAFAVYCEAIVHHRDACRDVDNRGILIHGQSGEVKNPALQIVRDQAAIIRSFGAEFGLTPSSRSTIKVPEAPTGPEARKLLSG